MHAELSANIMSLNMEQIANIVWHGFVLNKFATRLTDVYTYVCAYKCMYACILWRLSFPKCSGFKSLLC